MDGRAWQGCARAQEARPPTGHRQRKVGGAACKPGPRPLTFRENPASGIGQAYVVCPNDHDKKCPGWASLEALAINPF
eukprot:11736778-Karenia_brevis.AAC.1